MPHPFTRREFLSTGLVVVSTASSIPTFLHNSALAMADERLPQNRPGVPEQNILVVVQLSGGNDGLNTVVPYGSDDYYKARPVIAVPRNEVLVVDPKQGIGLHPEMAAISDMLQAQQACIVHGVGYPNPNRSHFASMDIWHTADVAGGGKGLGWIGQAMDQVAVNADKIVEPTACICIGHEPPLAAEGKLAKPIAFENAALFQWSGDDRDGKLSKPYDAINRAGVLAEIPAESTEAAFVMRTALDAQLASDRIRAAVARTPLTTFPGGALSQQLRHVAAMIRAELPTRVYYVALGGFDTHAGQLGRQPALLRQFSQGIKGFYDELKAMGQHKRVVTLAFSEFGRRVGQNASQGTDHGTAAPLFLFGDAVQPGLLGVHPELKASKLDNGDLVHTVDFRCIYTTLLDRWLKADSKQILGQAFRPANVLKT